MAREEIWRGGIALARSGLVSISAGDRRTLFHRHARFPQNRAWRKDARHRHDRAGHARTAHAVEDGFRRRAYLLGSPAFPTSIL